MRFLLMLGFFCAFSHSLLAADETAQPGEVASRAFVSSFVKKDFSALNKTAQGNLKDAARFSNGDWKLAAFYEGVELVATRNDDEDYWKTVEAEARLWIEKAPSAAAHIVYAKILLNHAAKIHGSRGDEDIGEDDWWKIEKYLGRSYDALLDCRDQCSADPEWYVTMIDIARADHWPPQKMSTLFTEAVKKHRYYDTIYYHISEILVPHHADGDYAPLDTFANKAVQSTGEKEHYAMYARIYGHMSSIKPKPDLFHATFVNWTVMKTGIEDILQSYPDQWNYNFYADLACQAGDAVETHALIEHISMPIALAWEGEYNKYDVCKRWAQ